MAVELSFDLSGPPYDHKVRGALDLWGLTVGLADSPCVVIDQTGTVVAISPGCAALLSVDVSTSVGRGLVGEVMDVRDFSAAVGTLPEWEVKKLPPVLAISSKGLARGLLRVWVGRAARTVDAVAVPLFDHGDVVGSLTFFAPVNQ